MKLDIYKGFNKDFLENIKEEPLIDLDLSTRLNVLKYDKKIKKKLRAKLFDMDDKDHKWLLYEEFTFIERNILDSIEDDDLKVKIIRNNIYPEFYPIDLEINNDLYNEIISLYEDENLNNERLSEECKNFEKIFSNLYLSSSNHFYASYYNKEYDNTRITIKDYFPTTTKIINSNEKGFVISSNISAKSYIDQLEQIISKNIRVISFNETIGPISNLISNSLKAICTLNNIKLLNYHEKVVIDEKKKNEIHKIAKNIIKIPNFKEFREIPFYKEPDISNEIVNISQEKIISEIITQAEVAYGENSTQYRDIFITASTGAGKSVMFQIPAVYLARKYQKLTIIIEPVKALMQDQKDQLNARGYNRVETFNSDLITQVEKEKVLNRIKNGEVDLLYLSPETLLSYSIETIIGDREIGLIIVDEAHIVTTWGFGFRPDYWYLGTYIYRLRHQIKTYRHKDQKIYNFPICAFTATAINGGSDDSVSETIISLYMNNPIKYIGKIKRDDISFKINVKSQKKLGKTEYENNKAKDLTLFLENTFDHNEKSIVYFPYASQAKHAKNQTNEFANLNADTHKTGWYVGRNINNDSKELFNQNKHEVFERFRKNEINAVFATKAFGMGVDVNDINNVYHYAVSGNLSDYIQEVGRAARKKNMSGTAYLDFYPNDMNFMQILFGMSQIRQWQVKQVLSNIYNIYLSKQSRNFLISPQAFTYIFSGKSKDDDKVINKLKTCLMMIEKDINDKNKFNVIITRPQSIFTKAFVVIDDNHKEEVLNSKYGDYFKYEHKGRFKVSQIDHYNESIVSDMGDIYTINLKNLWEDFYQNISFAQFKFWYFNSYSKNKIDVIPEIRKYIYPRQKIIVQSHHDLLINQIQKNILQELDKIQNDLYSTFGSNYFTLDKFANLLVSYENMTKTKAKLIADSLFDIVDPSCKCIKYRENETIGTREYYIRYGILGDLMKSVINKANIVKKMEKCNEQTFSSYICLDSSDEKYDSRALKLLSIFDYISYEVAGGEEPEIFIRLNDPSKIERIVNGRTKYSNDYVTRAQQKHKRDVDILRTFFLGLNNDKDRWNFIEDYFLGKDVLDNDYFKSDDNTPLANKIDKNKSFSTSKYKKWKDLSKFIDDSYGIVITEMSQNKIPLPEYLSTVIKNFEWTNDIVMSWPSKNTIVFSQDISDELIKRYTKDGYTVYRIFEIDYKSLKKEVG